MSNTYAFAIIAGDTLHRVKQAPLSAVFADPIDKVVTHTYPTPGHKDTHITIELGPDTKLNLAIMREVTLA